MKMVRDELCKNILVKCKQLICLCWANQNGERRTLQKVFCKMQIFGLLMLNKSKWLETNFAEGLLWNENLYANYVE